MYNVPFIMTIVVGIALLNLFLGFATALLAGRGPQRWSDLDRVVQVRYFSLGLLFGKNRPTRRQSESDADPLPNPEQAASGDQPARASCAEPLVKADCGMIESDDEPDRPERAPAIWKAALPTDKDATLTKHVPPHQVLDEQLQAWREQPEPRDTPSLSGLSLEVLTEDVEPSALDSLIQVVESRVAGQLRRDRHVLRVADRQFVWFSEDVDPDDAMMPLNRIRQLLQTTRFTAAMAAIDLRVAAAVVAATDRDSGPALLARLQRSLQFAARDCGNLTARDIGHGPEPVATTELDMDESVCALPA